MTSNTFKRRLSAGVLALGSLFTLAGTAAAETPIKASVPFDFVVGNTKLAAGDYTIQQISNDSREILMIRDAEGTPRAIINGVRTERLDAYGNPRLVFNKYEHGAVLSQVWMSTTEAGVSVPKNRLEKELMLGKAETESVALSAGK
jgi:hypothetical protein